MHFSLLTVAAKCPHILWSLVSSTPPFFSAPHSIFKISFFDKIFHFSIIDGNKTEIDLVLMQAFLFSSVNYVVRIFNGKKWRQRKAPLWLSIGRVTFLHLIRTNYFFLMWKHRSLLELARAHLGFNTEFTRILSNFDFQWTKILYQKN